MWEMWLQSTWSDGVALLGELNANRAQIMRKWLAIFSLIGLASSILFGYMFEPLSPHDPIDDAFAFLTIPWA